MASKIIKYFLTVIVTLSLLSGLPFFQSLTPLLGLSSMGIENNFYWQILTYLFFTPAVDGIQPGFLIHLFFNCFLLWNIGNHISYTKGPKHFVILFLGSGLLAGLVGATILIQAGSPFIFASTAPALFSLLMAMIILYHELELMLFLMIPIKAKWLILGILGSVLLMDLSAGLLLNFGTNLAGMIFGYLYAVIVWGQKSPFHALHAFESILLKIPKQLRFTKRSNLDDYDLSGAKIYDFKTGRKVFDDDSFIDACLSKISKEGKNSLSLHERFRLWRISRKRKYR